jgi:tRNA (guanosine-2'-O-)-methyltransferase
MKNIPLNVDYSFFKSEQRVNKIRQVLEKRQPDFTLVLENVHDPHNLSAVFRSADAVGVFEICLLYHSGQTVPKLSETSSASARKWVYHKDFSSVKECYNYLREAGKKIFTTKLTDNAVDLYDMDLTQPIALVFGNEHLGVSDEAFENADGNFLIPQVGIIQSLNISVAAAVSLFEVFRQRKNAGLYNKPALASQELEKEFQIWLRK